MSAAPAGQATSEDARAAQPRALPRGDREPHLVAIPVELLRPARVRGARAADLQERQGATEAVACPAGDVAG